MQFHSLTSLMSRSKLLTIDSEHRQKPKMHCSSYLRSTKYGTVLKCKLPNSRLLDYAGTIPISVEEANRLLQRMSKGKLTWEKLPEKEKLRVLHMIAPAKLIAHTANNALTQDQKDTVLANFWMQKGLSEITVSDKEVKDRYVKIKKMVKKSKNKKKFPEFSTLERSLKMQIAREKFVQSLTKNAKIKLK